MRLPTEPPRRAPRTGPARALEDAANPRPPVLTEVQDFGLNPGGLRMFVHLPAQGAEPMPLVVILHGCGQTAAGYDHGAGWSELGNRLGFAVLAPEQQNTNNMAGCFNWFQPGDTARDSGEAASIRQMIAYLLGGHGIDAKRIFIAGLSAGGAMTGAMLAAYPEIFAGGAIIAGLPYGAAANVPEALSAMRHAPERTPEVWSQAVRNASLHAGPWPIVSVWHGDADTTVHISNAKAVVAQWQNLQGLTAAEIEKAQGHSIQRWHRADGTLALESYILEGMAHGTPIRSGQDGGGNAGAFFIEAGLSSTLRIADFWGLSSALIIAKMAEAKKLVPTHETTADGAPPAPEMSGHADQADGVRGIIRKVLKAAGLLKD